MYILQRVFFCFLKLEALISRRYLIKTEDLNEINDENGGHDYQSQGCMPGYPCDNENNRCMSGYPCEETTGGKMER